MSLSTSCVKIGNKIISLEAIKMVDYRIGQYEYYHLFIPQGIVLKINYYIKTHNIKINLNVDKLISNISEYTNIKNEIERIYNIKKDKYEQHNKEEKEPLGPDLIYFSDYNFTSRMISKEKIWCGFGDIDDDIKKIIHNKFYLQLDDIGEKITKRIMELSQPFNTNFHDIIKWIKKVS